MRQISNETHAALLRHIPVLTEAVRGNRNSKVRTSAYVLMLAYKRMRRAEAINRRRNGHGKG